MKGLIRNNFYVSLGDAKLTMVIAAVTVLFVIVYELFTTTGIYLGVGTVVVVQIIGFITLAGVPLQKNAISNWSKFEITMPVKRTDVIKSQYVTAMIFGGMGLAFALITTIIFAIMSDVSIIVPLSGIASGLGFIFLIPALTFLISHSLGTDKAELVMVFSAGLSFVIYMAIFIAGMVLTKAPYSGDVSLLFTYSENVEPYRIMITGAFIAISIIMYMISYFVTTTIYKRREL